MAISHGQQLTVVAVGPTVILADQARPLAFGVGDDWGTPMAAGVVKGIDRAAVGVNEDHRLTRVFPQPEAAGLRDFVDVSGQQPGLAPDVALFEFEKPWVRVASTGQVGQVREPFRRCCAGRLVLHQFAQRGDFLSVHTCLPVAVAQWTR